MIPKSILEKLEPETATISTGNPLLISIAISMKRIADMLTMEQLHVPDLNKDQVAALRNQWSKQSHVFIEPPPRPDPSKPFKKS